MVAKAQVNAGSLETDLGKDEREVVRSILARKMGAGSSYGWDREPLHQRLRRIDS